VRHRSWPACKHSLYEVTGIFSLSRESHKRDFYAITLHLASLQTAARISPVPSVSPRHHHLFCLASTPNMSVTPMAYSTANWHWKNKTVTPWAKEWFERELVTIQVEGSDGAVVSVERVISVDGDVEIGRRKSKYVRAFSAASPRTLLRVVMHQANYPVQSRGRIFHFRQGLNCTDNVADLYDLQVDHDL
jgi:Activator of Hsp90 ATPase, N-terminal